MIFVDIADHVVRKNSPGVSGLCQQQGADRGLEKKHLRGFGASRDGTSRKKREPLEEQNLWAVMLSVLVIGGKVKANRSAKYCQGLERAAKALNISPSRLVTCCTIKRHLRNVPGISAAVPAGPATYLIGQSALLYANVPC